MRTTLQFYVMNMNDKEPFLANRLLSDYDVRIAIFPGAPSGLVAKLAETLEKTPTLRSMTRKSRDRVNDNNAKVFAVYEVIVDEKTTLPYKFHPLYNKLDRGALRMHFPVRSGSVRLNQQRSCPEISDLRGTPVNDYYLLPLVNEINRAYAATFEHDFMSSIADTQVQRNDEMYHTLKDIVESLPGTFVLAESRTDSNEAYRINFTMKDLSIEDIPLDGDVRFFLSYDPKIAVLAAGNVKEGSVLSSAVKDALRERFGEDKELRDEGYTHYEFQHVTEDHLIQN